MLIASESDDYLSLCQMLLKSEAKTTVTALMPTQSVHIRGHRTEAEYFASPAPMDVDIAGLHLNFRMKSTVTAETNTSSDFISR